MHRFTPALLAAFGLMLALAGLAFADPGPSRVDAPDQDLTLDLYMSATEGGALTRSFVSTTNQVYANIGYENARGQKYTLRVKDLSGITVFSKETATFNGAGSWSTAISITDFVTTYATNLAGGQVTLDETMSALGDQCQDIPPVPAVWPPSDPGDEYSKWLKDTLDKLESARSSTLEMTRTVQALASLPDVATDAVLAGGLATARDGLAVAEMKLGDAKPKMRPETGRPDPQAGCALIGEAGSAVDGAKLALTAAAASLAGADVSGWRLPLVAGRYGDGGEFLGCQQYATDLVQTDNPSDSPTKGVAWTVGDAGAPALIFPSPEEADRSSAGRLNVTYAGDAEAMYAQTVLVPGLNREAMIGAFVTDDKCVPVDGMSISFAVDPSEAGAISPAMVTLDQGVAETTLTSGSIAARAKVNAVISGGETVTGRGDFSVIGPASTVEFKGLRRSKLNRTALQAKDRRISLSVFATDANNQPVADLTAMVVEVRNDPNDPASPGVLAYERVRLNTNQREVVELGKRAELVSYKGFSTFFPCDAGYRCENLYLMAGNEADGRLTLVATVDGESVEARVDIVTEPQIFLPFLSKQFDLYAPPTYITIPPEPLATPSTDELRRR